MKNYSVLFITIAVLLFASHGVKAQSAVDSLQSTEIVKEEYAVHAPSFAERLRRKLIGTEFIMIYVNIENNQISGYSMRFPYDYATYVIVELTNDDFNILKNVFEKALEWDNIANQNDVEDFKKKIPLTIASNNISWETLSRSGVVYHTIKNDEMLTLEFTFSWTSWYIESARSALSIKSNVVHTSVEGSKEVLQLSKDDIHRAEVEFILENLTEAKIQESIVNGRIKKAEDEARKNRTETLFE